MVVRVEETAIISPTMPIVSAVAQAISTPLSMVLFPARSSLQRLNPFLPSGYIGGF